MYNIVVTLHIILAGIWLTNVLLNLSIKLNGSDQLQRKTIISLFLKLTNLIGMIGAVGILITGIYMTVANPAYSFFQFSANHWLVSKQVVMIVILVMIFAMLIPNAKAIRSQLMGGGESLDIVVLAKLNKITWTINILVIINILFALSRRMM